MFTVSVAEVRYGRRWNPWWLDVYTGNHGTGCCVAVFNCLCHVVSLGKWWWEFHTVALFFLHEENTVVVFKRSVSRGDKMNKAQNNNKNMTYLFKLATVSEAPHATPLPRLHQPMRARRTWRAIYSMTSSLLWDDVKFKMDGITTSAKKPLQHARKVAAVWWKGAPKTENTRW